MSDLDQLLKVSHFFGKSKDFVLAGGGNPSVKSADILYIKPSGVFLADIKKEEFIAIDRKKIRKTLEKRYSSDPLKREEQVKRDLLDARLDFKPNDVGPRPSVETGLHEIIDYKYIVHTHPNLINGLTCGKNGKRIANELFGKDCLWIDSTHPGYILTKILMNKLQNHKLKHKSEIPKIILIQNHGLFLSSNTVEDIYINVESLKTKINNYIRKTSNRVQPVFDHVKDKNLSKKDISCVLQTVSPTLRGILSKKLRKIIIFDDSEEVQKVVCSSNGRQIVTKGTFSPDHMVYCKEKPLWVNPGVKNLKNKDIEDLTAKVQTEILRYRRTNNFDPKIVFIEGVGMLAIGDSLKGAIIIRDIYIDFIKVAENTAAFGGPRFMSKQKVDFIEKWEVENYRRKLIRENSNGSVQNKVAVITGAGQGIGEGIARGLAEEGAYIVAADINLKIARRVADSLNKQYGFGRASAVKVDVTDSKEIKKMVDEAVQLYGGIDILVSNAGVLISGPTEDLTDEQLYKMTSVNYQAFFKIVRESVKIMKKQNALNKDYTSDIILISSKSGLHGSPANALYAGIAYQDIDTAV